VYVFLRNSFNSSQFFKFLCVITVQGSPLIPVSTNLYNVPSCLGSITSHAISTFTINAKTHLFSPLKGVTSNRPLPIEICRISSDAISIHNLTVYIWIQISHRLSKHSPFLNLLHVARRTDQSEELAGCSL
jgi:hypothetical protein